VHLHSYLGYDLKQVTIQETGHGTWESNKKDENYFLKENIKN